MVDEILSGVDEPLDERIGTDRLDDGLPLAIEDPLPASCVPPHRLAVKAEDEDVTEMHAGADRTCVGHVEHNPGLVCQDEVSAQLRVNYLIAAAMMPHSAGAPGVVQGEG